MVVEIKRTEDGGHMELQAIRYAAMVSTMTFEKALEVYTACLSKGGDGDGARDSLLEFLGWEQPQPDLFAQGVRILLVSAEFSREIATSVLWLNDHDLDIRCVRIKPYQANGQLLVDVQQLIPLPLASEYQVQIREKERTKRTARSHRSELRLEFTTQLLQTAIGKTALHADAKPGKGGWCYARAGVRGLQLCYNVREHESYALLYIDRGTGKVEENKAIFDRLLEAKDAIEGPFGRPLEWLRRDGKTVSMLRAMVDGGFEDDRQRWTEIREALAEAMIRLERALRPSLEELKSRHT